MILARDDFLPPDGHYRGAFEFSGRLDQVVVDLPQTPISQP